MKFLVILPLLGLVAPPAFAQQESGSAATAGVPAYLNFQSVLTDAGGNVLPDPFIDLRFEIANGPGQLVYSEEQRSVQSVRGAVNVMIGEGTVVGSDGQTPTGGIPWQDLDPAEGPYTLKTTVGGDVQLEDLELVSNVYSFWSGRALSVIPDSIGSEEIRDGSIRREDLEPGLTFADLSGQASEDQIPATFATDTELSQHTGSSGAHPASSVTVVGPFTFSLGGTVEQTLVDLDGMLTQEVVNRRLDIQGVTNSLDAAQATLTTQINTETGNRQAAVTQEAADRTTADTNLQNALTTANNNITTLQTNVTNLQTTTTTLDNLPGTLSESKVDGSIARDTEVVTIADQRIDSAIANNTIPTQGELDSLSGSLSTEATSRANADSSLQTQINTVSGSLSALNYDGDYVNVSGDTMSGGLNMGGNSVTNVGSGSGIGFTVADHENRIDALETDIQFSDINGQVATAQIPSSITRDSEVDDLVPQYMRPFAFGSVDSDGDLVGSGSYNLVDAANASGNCPSGGTSYEVAFDDDPPNANYFVFATAVAVAPQTISVRSKTTSGFIVCSGSTSSNSWPVDVIVFGNF